MASSRCHDKVLTGSSEPIVIRHFCRSATSICRNYDSCQRVHRITFPLIMSSFPYHLLSRTHLTERALRDLNRLQAEAVQPLQIPQPERFDLQSGGPDLSDLRGVSRCFVYVFQASNLASLPWHPPIFHPLQKPESQALTMPTSPCFFLTSAPVWILSPWMLNRQAISMKSLIL